jgi:hypothetical protein
MKSVYLRRVAPWGFHVAVAPIQDPARRSHSSPRLRGTPAADEWGLCAARRVDVQRVLFRRQRRVRLRLRRFRPGLRRRIGATLWVPDRGHRLQRRRRMPGRTRSVDVQPELLRRQRRLRLRLRCSGPRLRAWRPDALRVLGGCRRLQCRRGVPRCSGELDLPKAVLRRARRVRLWVRRARPRLRGRRPNPARVHVRRDRMLGGGDLPDASSGMVLSREPLRERRRLRLRVWRVRPRLQSPKSDPLWLRAGGFGLHGDRPMPVGADVLDLSGVVARRGRWL